VKQTEKGWTIERMNNKGEMVDVDGRENIQKIERGSPPGRR
jgi:hypothetical protein